MYKKHKRELVLIKSGGNVYLFSGILVRCITLMSLHDVMRQRNYQINDTVVVFDRVRENIGLYPKQDFFTTINNSINTTLSRTIMTSASTLLVLLCIFILGGDSIRSFTFAMLFGVIIGTLATCPVAFLTDSRRKAAAAKKK